MSTIGERIKERRKELNITQQYIKKTTGISTGNLSDIENNNSMPSANALISLSRELKVSIDWILLGTTYSDRTTTNNTIIEVTESNLIESFNKLHKKHKMRILAKIENYLEEYQDEETDNIIVHEVDSTYNIKNIPLLISDDEGFIQALKKRKSKKVVPMLGTTAAGEPIDIVENVSDVLSVPGNVKIDFALKVKGNSMFPLIRPGDYIFLKQDLIIENGNIIVASIDNTATCKKYYNHNDYIELKSLNPDYDPIVINKDKEIDFRIVGKVVFAQRDGNFFDIK